MDRGIGVTETLRNTLPDGSIPLFELLSLGGDLLLIVPTLALLYVGAVINSLRHTPTEHPLCPDRTAFIIAAVFGGLALVVLLKPVFGMPRPPAALHAVSPSEYGFPSGHTMAATVFWGAIALWTTIGRQRVRLWIAVAVVSLVALSRLALGVHFAVDVLASVAFGSLYLVAFEQATGSRPSRAFAVAVVIAGGAVLASGASSRSLLALVGTVGAGVGWWVIERPFVSTLLVTVVDTVRARYPTF